MSTTTASISSSSFSDLPNEFNPTSWTSSVKSAACMQSAQIQPKFADLNNCYKNSGNLSDCISSTGYDAAQKAYQSCVAGNSESSTTSSTQTISNGGQVDILKIVLIVLQTINFIISAGIILYIFFKFRKK